MNFRGRILLEVQRGSLCSTLSPLPVPCVCGGGWGLSVCARARWGWNPGAQASAHIPATEHLLVRIGYRFYSAPVSSLLHDICKHRILWFKLNRNLRVSPLLVSQNLSRLSATSAMSLSLLLRAAPGEMDSPLICPSPGECMSGLPPGTWEEFD